jgi:hypothetical protein
MLVFENVDMMLILLQVMVMKHSPSYQEALKQQQHATTPMRMHKSPTIIRTSVGLMDARLTADEDADAVALHQQLPRPAKLSGARSDESLDTTTSEEESEHEIVSNPVIVEHRASPAQQTVVFRKKITSTTTSEEENTSER